LLGRQRFVSRALEADEFRDVFKVLAEHVVSALGHHGDVAQAQLEKALAAARIIGYVHCFEVDAFTRKKLFRPQTAASSRLRKQHEFVGDGITHGKIRGKKRGE
jgi:hypothetical protein